MSAAEHDIFYYLNQLANAEEGEEVRWGIYWSIYKCYSDVNNPTLLLDGIQSIVQDFIDDGTISGEVLEDLGILTEATNNLFDCFDLETGLLSTSGVLDSTATGYRTTDYIAVTAGTTYYNTNLYRLVYYDSSKVFSAYANSPSTYTPAADGFIRVSVTSANRQTAKINAGSSQTYRPGRSAVDWNLRDDVYRKSEIDTMIANIDVSLTAEQIATLTGLLD